MIPLNVEARLHQLHVNYTREDQLYGVIKCRSNEQN